MNSPEQDRVRRILLVDDTLAIHEDFRKILLHDEDHELDRAEAELFGCSKSRELRQVCLLDSAYQGQEGLELVRRALGEQRPYAMAFVDIRMPPGWDGIETISQLWAVDRELQIVICTAYSDYSWDEISRRFGPTDNLVILKKPFDNIEVLQLSHALTRKWALNRESKRRLDSLDEAVRNRTGQLSAANEELRREVDERKRAEVRIRAFSKLGQRLSATKTARAAAEIIFEAADELVGWDACFLDLYSAQQDLISPVFYADVIDGERRICLPDYKNHPPSPLGRKAIQEGGQLLFKEQPQNMEPGTMSFGDRARPSASILIVPIHNGASIIGIISIQSYRPRAFDPASLELLQALADHCAGALDRIHAEEVLETTQQQLRQSQKLEAIGQLAGGVAHDFNNLLTVIRGNTDLVLANASGLQPMAVECLKQSVAAAERAAKLTRQLLAFSRKQVFQLQPLKLDEIVTNLTKMLRRIIGEDIELVCQCDAALPLINGDAAMLEQVIVNLAVNARDAISGGGKLTIATQEVELDAVAARRHEDARPGRFVALRVTDTGSGILPQDLPHIFEPFFTTKAVGKGTGLGLSTAYGIIRQHQGWIDVSSAIGAGSTFTLFLPISDAPARGSAPAEKGSRFPRGTERILLVEDDDSVRLLTRRLLENVGYKVQEAASGPAAMDVYRSGALSTDLLLTDIIMPEGMNGRELAEQLRATNPQLKVIFTSGYSGDVLGSDPHFESTTNSRFLAKPCPPQVLLQTVRECLDGSIHPNGKGRTVPVHG